MRVRFLLALAAFTSASPALAAPDTSAIEQALRDPATAQKLDRSLETMTDALLDLKVGGMKAALEGREAAPGERSLTLREMERRAGRDPEAIRRTIREAGPAISGSLNALANALPAMTKALDDISRAVDRAAANMPDPTYPKR